MKLKYMMFFVLTLLTSFLTSVQADGMNAFESVAVVTDYDSIRRTIVLDGETYELALKPYIDLQEAVKEKKIESVIGARLSFMIDYKGKENKIVRVWIHSKDNRELVKGYILP